MNNQIIDMIKAQDIIRQVYVKHKNTEIEKRLKELDKDLTKIINLIGSERN